MLRLLAFLFIFFNLRVRNIGIAREYLSCLLLYPRSRFLSKLWKAHCKVSLLYSNRLTGGCQPREIRPWGVRQSLRPLEAVAVYFLPRFGVIWREWGPHAAKDFYINSFTLPENCSPDAALWIAPYSWKWLLTLTALHLTCLSLGKFLVDAFSHNF